MWFGKAASSHSLTVSALVESDNLVSLIKDLIYQLNSRLKPGNVGYKSHSFTSQDDNQAIVVPS